VLVTIREELAGFHLNKDGRGAANPRLKEQITVPFVIVMKGLAIG
jgi:hypothetical protein